MVSKLGLYKIFQQVSRSKSFSKAAEELYMTQPAVSQSIMNLEKELNIRLFNRTSKGVTLTNEGQHLYEYVNSALSLLEAGENKILEFKNLLEGELKIGAGDTISKYYLIKYLEEFHRLYPNIKLKIRNGTTLELCQLVKSGEIDIAVCNFPIKDSTLKMKPIKQIQDIFICGEKYKKILGKKVKFNELVESPLIFLEKNSVSRKYVEGFIESKGYKISPEVEIGSYDLLLEFAKINLGVACVIREFSSEYIDKGIVYEVNIEEEIPKRDIGVCYAKKVPLSLAAIKFIELLK